MPENQGPQNEAISQLVKSFQEANQAIVENVVAAQEGNIQFAQSIFMDWIETLKNQAESTHSLMQEVEQQTQKQQEAFYRLAQESLKNSFNLLHAPLSSYPPSLRLTESLRICLLALASRYPRHLVDINEEILGPQSLGADGWKAPDIIELLQSTAAQVLQERARLEVNMQRKGIYLIERSEEIPGFWIHCGEDGEKMPASQGNLAVRRAKQTQRRDEAPAEGGK